jgi:hypothetical protein
MKFYVYRDKDGALFIVSGGVDPREMLCEAPVNLKGEPFAIESLDIAEVDGVWRASFNAEKHAAHIERQKKAIADQALLEENKRLARIEAEKNVRERVKRKRKRAKRIKEIAGTESGLIREIVDQLLDD